MNLSRKFRKQVLLALDPRAFDQGTLVREVEDNEARLARDPNVQKRRAESIAAVNKESLPPLIGATVFNAALWGGTGWFFRDLFEPLGGVVAVAVIGFVITSAVLWNACWLR